MTLQKRSSWWWSKGNNRRKRHVRCLAFVICFPSRLRSRSAFFDKWQLKLHSRLQWQSVLHFSPSLLSVRHTKDSKRDNNSWDHFFMFALRPFLHLSLKNHQNIWSPVMSYKCLSVALTLDASFLLQRKTNSKSQAQITSIVRCQTQPSK